MSETLAASIARLLPDDGPVFALAFSGGGDSLALLNVLKDHPRLAAVLHVDHGLRAWSADEAERAKGLAQALGHELTLLKAEMEPGSRGLQEKARRARYALMGEACRERVIEHLVTAHHADDQAETVLMRLVRGSGWRGAAGMAERVYAPVWPELAAVTLVRPALRIDRADLRTHVGGMEPVEDPSNRNTDFERVRARDRLSNDPIMKTDMLALSQDMARGVEAERERMSLELQDYHLTHEGLFRLPRLPSVTALARLAPIMGGQSGPSRRERIADGREALLTRGRVALGQGCLAQWDGQILTLSRDPVAMTGRSDGRLPPSAIRLELSPEKTLWDGRFLFSGEAGIIQPERRGDHVGFRILYGRNVSVRNLVQERLRAWLTGM